MPVWRGFAAIDDERRVSWIGGESRIDSQRGEAQPGIYGPSRLA
jgi:hypothetical protein